MLQWTIATLIRKTNVNIDFSEHIRHAQLLSGLGISEKNKSRDPSGEFLIGKIALHLPPRDKKISP
jgi:hypothetical protein